LIMKNSYDTDFALKDDICKRGLVPVFVYRKKINTGDYGGKKYQSISFEGSCFESDPQHYFFSRTSPFNESPYKDIISGLSEYHYLKTWEKDPEQIKSSKRNIKSGIKKSNKILLDKKERKSVHSFLTAYGKLMKDSIKTRKLHRDELKNKSNKEKEKRIADLKNRVRKPINIDEAAIYFGAGGCCVPIYSTPYKPDNELYTFVGFVKGKLNGKYILEIDNDILGKRKFLLNTPEVFNEGALIQAVGKFSEVAMLRTLFSEVKKPFAVFSDIKYLIKDIGGKGKILN